jgi:Xaa-Pro aminopeptidase
MPDWTGRLKRLEQHCVAQQLDAFVVSSPINVKYLSGFDGSAGLLLCTPHGHCLITDGRYESQVRDWMREGRVAAIDLERVEARYDLTLAARLGRLPARQVGVEADFVTVATLRRWQELTSDTAWRPMDQVVERMRLIKDESELADLRRGGRALADVAKRLADWVRRGRAERELARDIDQAIERAGFERPAFDTIVASGPNSAYPHARPTDRRLTDGDLVVLDFGGVLDGYCVDLTRMAGIGQIGSAAERLYRLDRDAQSAALAAVRAGVLGSDVDAAARQLLESNGLGAAFVHGTGHGLGLEVHEAPRLARATAAAADLLEAGMVCTIEPGAYIEGLGGVRLEDDVVVTGEGSELLTDAPRDLLMI